MGGYQELRTLAAHKLANEPARHTLQPTALVHEAWLQLVGSNGQSRQNRAHFSGAAEAMRRILIARAWLSNEISPDCGEGRSEEAERPSSSTESHP